MANFVLSTTLDYEHDHNERERHGQQRGAQAARYTCVYDREITASPKKHEQQLPSAREISKLLKNLQEGGKEVNKDTNYK